MADDNQTDQPELSEQRLSRKRDRRVCIVLFISFLILFSYFQQGGGWNQNAFMDMVFAIVNDGTLEITPYAHNTGDAVHVDGKVFAYKPAGLALWTSVFYFPFHFVQRMMDVDFTQPSVQSFNVHLMNLFGAGLPAAMTVVGLFVFFRYRKLSGRAAVFLAAAFGTGSLILPYSGMLMRENLMAGCLLWGWLLIGNSSTVPRCLLAGALLGLAFMTDLIIAPMLLVWLIIIVADRGFSRQTFAVFLPMVVAGLMVGGINWLMFGAPWTTVYSHVPEHFKNPELFMGVFDAPDLRRVYWLSFHPYRGLFFCAPVMLLGFGFLLNLKALRKLDVMTSLAVVTILQYCMFNLCFNGWTAGWGIGPRYLVPMLPIFFSFVYLGWPRIRFVAFPVALLSTYIMIGVTSVAAMIPAEDSGPPVPGFNPVFKALAYFHKGQVSIHTSKVSVFESPVYETKQFNSYNLGEVMGLEGLWSLLPLGAVAVVSAGVLVFLTKKRDE